MDATNDDTGPAADAAIATHRKTAPPAIVARFGSTPENSRILKAISADTVARQDRLSVRAENVLKELLAELTGENPPKGRWTPPTRLLRMLTFRDLLAARNCGPQTSDEIIRWAKSQGVVIQPPFHSGKSLSAMWRNLIAKSSNGQFSRAEIAEALERSTRRRNTRIPVAFQSILVKLLSSTGT